MPILVGAPSSGLGEGLSTLGQVLGTALQKRGESQKRQSLWSDITESFKNAAPQEYPSILANAIAKGGSAQDIQSFVPLLSQLTKSYGDFQKTEGLAQQKLEEKQDAQKQWGNVFQGLKENLPYTGMPVPFTKSMFAYFPWSKAAEQRELFDVLAFQLEKYARAEHTKGTLSAKVYESLLSKLPDSKLSNAKNLGRIKAWEGVIMQDENLPVTSEEASAQTNQRKPLTDIFK